MSRVFLTSDVILKAWALVRGRNTAYYVTIFLYMVELSQNAMCRSLGTYLLNPFRESELRGIKKKEETKNI